ncbi:MAG: isoleucine--tRNA ligase [Cyanobacteria bacterium NC_groundwater_1444_Ag_S-0.65um_54_12]|nr:isoleucine--tRNA ligase [Cyanobacteria bacterium NC_groundwater_1444_Ag_S-0.65um_54_12]
MDPYKNKLYLPQTDFPMRANASIREPEIQALWRDNKLYDQLIAKRRGGPRFVLHDGPPYSSSGRIHIGHALNKILKDLVVKYKILAGYEAPFIPGYDTHGLPTEIAALKELKSKRQSLGPIAIRAVCQEFANKSIASQQQAFQRLGVFGDWDHPYLTLQPEFEACQIRIFGQMAEKGYIYKGLKPVHWCCSCVTALAEAEVEYEDVTSPAIYVSFPLLRAASVPIIAERLAAGRPVGLLIWTTTPWTLPANLAIAVNPDFDYTLLAMPERDLVVAKERVATIRQEAGLAAAKETGIHFKGRELEHAAYAHVWLERESEVILGQHVTLASGSGLVHTAPGHGHDDYVVSLAYGLPILAPLDDHGYFTSEGGELTDRLFYAAANPIIIAELAAREALLGATTITHSYPHCWRCHKPIVFRATEQWFASVAGFRQQALAALETVRWHPEFGELRMANMISERADWCISRQRVWGVPIPVFYCDSCHYPGITAETIERVAEIFAKEGSDAWWTHEASALLPEGMVCSKCGHDHFSKETDIMDVWFDSGVTHEAVCAARGLGWPVDLYLEGSDQYRGWFQSSLLTAVATRNSAPYRMVITHGFALDGQGRKMSKSLGNVMEPDAVVKQYGADVLRLWVSSVDYTGDVRISAPILQQLAEVYRKIRNTARFLLGNLYDFVPQRDLVDHARLPEIDRFALHRLQEIMRQVQHCFENYEYYTFYQLIQNYCVVDLSSFYLDVLKDRLYASQAHDSPARRSAQTALHHILQNLLRLISPVLSHLAEDIYLHLPAEQRAEVPSVFLLDFPKAEENWRDEALARRWEEILTLRSQVYRLLEEARQRKEIGSSSDAMVMVPASAVPEEILREALNVSQVVVDDTLQLPVVGRASGEKCQRCWLILPEVAEPAAGLCKRCTAAMLQDAMT